MSVDEKIAAAIARARGEGAAFPGIESPGGGYPGMLLRDYFAALAMLGYLTTSDEPTAREAALHAEKCAEWAYIQADAMLKASETK